MPLGGLQCLNRNNTKQEEKMKKWYLWCMAAAMLCACDVKEDVEPKSIKINTESSRRNINKTGISNTGSPIYDKLYEACEESYQFTTGGLDHMGKLYFPKNPDLPNCTTIEEAPLLLLLHGNSYTYKNYSYWAEHLAKNGFIVASINRYVGDVKITMLHHLDYLFNESSIKDAISENNVSLAGHSVGGASCVRYASAVKEHLGDHKLKTIILLAPAPSYPDLQNNIKLAGTTESVLGMYGSKDEDITGSIAPNGEVFSIGEYFSNIENEGISFAPHATFMFLKDFSHCVFAGNGAVYQNVCLYGTKEQEDMIKGYLNAWMKLYALGESEYNQYFKYQKRIPFLDPSIEFSILHKEHERMPLVNFENNMSKYLNNWNGTYQATGNIHFAIDYAYELDPCTIHNDKVMIIKFESTYSEAARMKFNFPGVDISPWNYLNLNLTQVYRPNQNPEGDDLNISIKITTEDSYSILPLTSYNKLPFSQIISNFQSLDGNVPVMTKNVMRSFLIPKEHFAELDLTKLTSIELVFNDPQNLEGWIIVDNIEVTM